MVGSDHGDKDAVVDDELKLAHIGMRMSWRAFSQQGNTCYMLKVMYDD
jgi:hypothetical protein